MAAPSSSANGLKPTGGLSANDNIRRFAAPSRPLSPLPAHALFNDKTRCFVYGLQPRAVQGMLDFDFICKRTTPSVAGIIYTFGGQFVSKMYWGTSETLLPVYQQVEKAMAKHPDVDTVVNFASSRSVYSSTMELMENPQIKTIAIIAEGVPERVSDPSLSYSRLYKVANRLYYSVPVRSRMSRRRRVSQSLALPPLVASSPAASRLATLVV
jgi:ATP citrate (pro-S)-lyase